MSNYNTNSGYGRALLDALHGILPVFGRVFVVCSPSDTADPNYQKLQEVCTNDPYGVLRFYTSLSDAYDATTTNNNDVILIDAHTTHTVTEMLTVAKNRVHFIGMDGGGRLMSPRAKIQMGVTGVATDLAPILVTGVGCSFRNIKSINASTTNQSLYGFIDNGEATVIENCHFLKVAGLDDANHAHFWMAGDSCTYQNIVAGQSNIPNTAAGFGILIDGKTGGATDGTVKENYAKNVVVNMSVGGSVQATSCLIKIADTAALNFSNIIDGFTGTNFIPSGGTIMTNAVLAPASITAGTLFLIDPVFAGATGVSDNASAGVQIVARGLAPVTAGGLAANLSD
jgi:hypothetical protein